jgi:rhodanese-related sulfurtransferase/DNA-directed RNA polymerase subunit RPC12/RpoP
MKNMMLILLITVCYESYAQKGQYQCMPCGNDCDKESYEKPGNCPHCNMQLVKKSTINFKSIKPEEVCAYVAQHPDVMLLDVRTKEEYDGKTDDYGTLKNAINIPIQELESRVGELKDVKGKEIIVYCSFSKRSPRASYFLTQNGFKHVVNMEGGMSTMTDKSCKR